MWTSIYLAQTKQKAELIRAELEKMKIIVRIKQIMQCEGATEPCYEVFVPSAEVQIALDIIINL